MATDPSIRAMLSLSELVRSAKSEELAHGWLKLQVRLRSGADSLIMAESAEALRVVVQQGCQAYLEFISEAATAAAAEEATAKTLELLQRRSTNYLTRIKESFRHLVANGGELLEALLRAGGGTAVSVRGASLTEGAGLTRGGGPTSHGGTGRCAQAAAYTSGCDIDSDGGPFVLTHDYSPYVVALLLWAAEREHFTLLVAESRPDGGGHQTAITMLEAGVPVRMVEFGAVARCMARAQLVLVGATAVLADGGVLAPIGTLTIAYAAHAHGRPFYVAAPQHLFCRTHHLDATAQTITRGAPTSTRNPILRELPARDATPPHLVTLLLTDVGVLTPSAVADIDLQMR